MILNGRMISPGKAGGTVLKLEEPLSFLGGVDGSTGELRAGTGGNVAGKILVFPKGKGSTVGSFVMYDLMVHGKQPAAVINETAETIVATGAVISSIPMIDEIPVNILKTGDKASVDADTGTVTLPDLELREKICFATKCGSGWKTEFEDAGSGASRDGYGELPAQYRRKKSVCASVLRAVQ